MTLVLQYMETGKSKQVEPPLLCYSFFGKRHRSSIVLTWLHSLCKLWFSNIHGARKVEEPFHLFSPLPTLYVDFLHGNCLEQLHCSTFSSFHTRYRTVAGRWPDDITFNIKVSRAINKQWGPISHHDRSKTAGKRGPFVGLSTVAMRRSQ